VREGGKAMFGSIDEAVKAYGVSKATIERKIAKGELPSYREGSLGRKVWLKTFDPLKVTLEMLTDEIANLRKSAVQEAIPQQLRVDPQPLNVVPQQLRVLSSKPYTKRRREPDFDSILSLIKDRWQAPGRSLNELDEEMGFCQGWSSRLFSKKLDKRGQLPKRSKRCWGNWEKIEAFLTEDQQAQQAA
jgi:excisionase family DNA binding protein